MSFPYLWIFLGKIDPFDSLIYILLSYCTILGIAGFGYLTNDLGDRKKDKTIGKENVTNDIHTHWIYLLMLGFLLMAIGPWLVFPKVVASYGLLIAEFLLFILYAFPPFRLKERKWSGILADALYAHTIPCGLAALTFYLLRTTDYLHFSHFLIGLALWQMTVGIRNILLHQLSDVDQDLKAGVTTMVTDIGKRQVEKILLGFILPVEAITFLGFLIYLYQHISMLTIGYFIFMGYQLFVGNIHRKNNYRQNIYEFLDNYYLNWFPVLILLNLFVDQFSYLVVLAIHMLFFDNFLVKIFIRIKNKFLKLLFG